ncbi:MAG: hypothetical protein FWF92_08470 [Oscillospiraceae bacterium]|nr:hypothetical protein [Oscillospiraceae bacterium]
MKRLLSIFFTLTFIFSLLSGCTNTNNDKNKMPDKTIETVETMTEMIEEMVYPELKIEIVPYENDENRFYERITNYVFIPDNKVLGNWESFAWFRSYDELVVDLESDIVICREENNYNESTLEEFINNFLNNPDIGMYWNNISFYEDGTIISDFSAPLVNIGNSMWNQTIWTKGYIINPYYPDTLSSYTIKNIGGEDYLFVKWSDGVTLYGEVYFVFKKDPNIKYLDLYADIKWKNLRNYDLSGLKNIILSIDFDEKTIFPPKDKMPNDSRFQPEYMLEAGKNPGLGVRSIHEQGITGKGVNVAIIDKAIIIDHPEYNGKIIEYTNLSTNISSIHGPGVASLLVGENIGTAPGAKVYYYGRAEKYIDGKSDAESYADVLDMIVEKNKTLPDGEKIRVVSISSAPTPSNTAILWVNGEKYLDSVKQAQETGILVLDCSDENGIIDVCGYNFDKPDDITLCTPGYLNGMWRDDISENLRAPVWYRTIAEVLNEGDFLYAYDGQGGLSWAIPYATGVLAMGWQVKPELTADEIVQILFDTAYVGKDGNKYIYPTAFIEYLKNN